MELYQEAAGRSQTTLDGIEPTRDVCPEGPEVKLSHRLCPPGSTGDEVISETSHGILTWTVGNQPPRFCFCRSDHFSQFSDWLGHSGTN